MSRKVKMASLVILAVVTAVLVVIWEDTKREAMKLEFKEEGGQTRATIVSTVNMLGGGPGGHKNPGEVEETYLIKYVYVLNGKEYKGERVISRKEMIKAQIASIEQGEVGQRLSIVYLADEPSEHMLGCRVFEKLPAESIIIKN